jgi:hypothetical protein
MGSGSQVLAGPRIEGPDASGTKAYHWERGALALSLGPSLGLGARDSRQGLRLVEELDVESVGNMKA